MGVRRIYKVGSPYNASELSEIDFVQSFDVMYLAHRDHVPTKLSRAGHTSWLFGDVTFGPTIAPPTGVGASASSPNVDAANSGDAYFPQDALYVVTAVSEDTGQETRASASATAHNDLTLKRNFNTVTWSAVTGAARYRVYKANNTGAYGFLGQTKDGTTLSFVDDFIDADLTVGPPVQANPFVTTGDRPSTVAFFEQRLWWGRTYNNPNALYSSRSADFENMDISEPLRADDAISIRLVAQGVNEANQLVPLQSLMAFSSDGIFKIEGSNEEYLSASPPPRQKRQSSSGCSRLSPIVIDGMAFYKPLKSSEIHSAGYDFQIDGVKSDNVCVFSPDFFRGFDIVSWCYVEEPWSVILAARSDGQLLCFTWQRDQQVWGWTNWPLPNAGKAKSVCCIEEIGSDGVPESRVYAIIEYTIAGVARQVRCRLASGRWQGLAYECHLDCSTTVVFADPTSYVTGLWHLEGETVTAFLDGVIVDNLVVNGGRVDFPEGVTGRVATVGLPFDAIAETLPLFIPAGRTNAGRVHSVSQVMLALERTRAPEVGVRYAEEAEVREGRMRPVKARYTGPASDEASLLNGLYKIPTDPIATLQATATIKGRVGPLTVVAAYLDPEVSG